MDTKVNNLDISLAERLRIERLARRWSMADLAERSGVSKAMIGKIEKAEASPTAALLGRLSAAFGLTLSTLLARAEGHASRYVARADQPVWTDPETGYLRRSVTPPGERGLEIVEVTLPPDAEVAYPAAAFAFLQQQMLVLSGRLTFAEGDRDHVFEAGDWFALAEPAPCIFRNRGDGPCTYLVLIQPK